ncbi:MAG: PINc/VapC family ATPase [Euryarchaeota archaeon]|nr:PINc/VapC family ATPase [Euryarchaeota archaeon]
MKVLPDTSVIIDGRFREFLMENEVIVVLLNEAVVAEIEHQAVTGKTSGESGLEELRKIKELCRKKDIDIDFAGDRPPLNRLKDVDDIIRSSADINDAILITGDVVQKTIAEIKGINVRYIPAKTGIKMSIEDFFDETTMSVHLKDGIRATSKKGTPKDIFFEKKGEPMSEKELNDISLDIVERAEREKGCFIEMDEQGAIIVQLKEYRIAITKPPFSDGFEITAVRPVRKLSLKEYDISEKLRERLKDAEGILVAGSPGAGKSTFVQALAEYYNEKGKIIKTMEKPRDLQVSSEITQYTSLGGSMEKTADVLLLVRPDFTVFDEMRKTNDFLIYADMRLAGVGLIGVVHASRTIDSIQRFIGRVELGMIPQIIDTIIHIDRGEIGDVFSLRYTVKVPYGMGEADLARPVIEVRDFEEDSLRYEIYSYGEQVVVMPVKKRDIKPPANLSREIKKYIQGNFEIEMITNSKAIVYVNQEDVPRIIGKKGKNIDLVEKKSGISIDVREKEINSPVGVRKTKKYYILQTSFGKEKLDIYLDSSYFLTAYANKKGKVKIKRNSKLGKELGKALSSKASVQAEPSQKNSK